MATTLEPVPSTTNIQADRHLCVAVDDSEDAAHALDWVLSNVARPGDGIHLLHVLQEEDADAGATALQIHPGMWIPIHEDDDDAGGGGGGGIDDAAAAAAVAMIRRRFVGRLAAAGLPFEVHLLPVAAASEPAAVAAAVSDKARSLGAACVVVAHHPSSPLKTWWRGSVAAGLARDAKGVPTLVVH